ncbi:MAG: flavodoxin-dependent (E)-4-hydroxy-3-methylbut-2-enyl-diphosphate synthase [Huintestinicola sp.]
MRKVNAVKVGELTLDGKKIYIQSMLSVPSSDIEGNVSQAVRLEKAGCEIIRVSVPDEAAVALIPAIKSAVNIPVVADIHFDYRLALKSAEAGVDKIRINPGNIGGKDRVKAVADCCRERGIPIRIGVNSGSVEKHILEKYGSPTPEALVESALYHASLLEECDFHDIVLSIKSSDVKTMISAYRLAAEKCSYPLHLGVTEAGTERMGVIKSAVGIGSLLCDGIGETIRVSLTDDPVREIYAAKDILKAIGIGHGVKLISCPTCGRTKIDLVGLAKRVEEAVADIDSDITVAVMGCVVNGPGEAKEADIGIAGGDGCAVIFKKGQMLRKVSENDILSELMKEIQIIREEKLCL